MLLMLELWDGLLINPMGVVRNPIDVAESLVRRGEPITRQQGVALWKTYNRALLHYARTHDCPIAFFDDPHFVDQVISCARHLGYSVHTDAQFFDDQLVRSRTENWRDLVGDNEAVALYDDLTKLAINALSEISRRGELL